MNLLFNSLTVLICTHNGSLKLPQTLRHLANQELNREEFDIELLVVDNASTDGVSEKIKQSWNELGNPFPLTIIYEPKKGKPSALTTGYNHAKKELILLCDDDNWLNSKYIKTVFELFNQYPGIGMLGGYGSDAYFGPDEKPGWFDRFKNHYVVGKHHSENGFLEKLDNTLWGAGSVIRKSVWDFLMQAGFSFSGLTTERKAMTEDVELSTAISFTKYRLYFDDRLTFIHDLSGGRVNWKNFVQQSVINGRGNVILAIYHYSYNQIKENGKAPFIKAFISIAGHNIIKLIKLACKNVFSSSNREIYIQLVHKKAMVKELLLSYSSYKKKYSESKRWLATVINSQVSVKICS